ncbi:MAG: response regulator transcription factor [Ignavibacteriae bacterium]|nr:response regulator transcription factor [Ignavibacteriota bacterium]
MVTIGIVEDDKEVRDTLRAFCDSSTCFHCEIAEASAEALFAKLAGENVPDVILMDIGLPGMSGIDAIKLLKERHPTTDIIMLTVYHDPHRIFESLRAGASGYLLKSTSFSQIKDAIEVVHAGGAYMSPQIARKVVDYFHPHHPLETPSPLTLKEREVVFGLVEGLSYKMIASRMSITIETVRSHIKHTYQKLHVHSRAEVIGKSLRGEI